MENDSYTISGNGEPRKLPNALSNLMEKTDSQSSIRRKERLKKIVAKLRWQKCTNAAKAFARFSSISTMGNSSD